jgi:YgiT-type zinc finger domain-containing protein
MKCFECDGEYEKIVQDYEFITNKGTKMIVPDMEILTCNVCGDKCLDDENSKRIDRARDIGTEGIKFIVDLYKKCLEEYSTNLHQQDKE